MKLVVALDLPTPKENLHLVSTLKDDVYLKVGLNTFIAGGPEFINKLAGFPVVLDLKLYDIPNTMANAATRITELEVDMFTIHASAGDYAMKTVMEAMSKITNPPKVLAVTVLTSFTDNQCADIYHMDAKSIAQELAISAAICGIDGIVCSIQEAPDLHPMPFKFVPGIRFQYTKDDQKRVGGLKEAYLAGAEYVVIGRPIYQSKNPSATVSEIVNRIKTIENAMKEIDNASKGDLP